MSAARTFLIEPFDILLHATKDGVNALQARFSTWLRTLRDPARFVCWQMPTTLDGKIAQLNGSANETNDPARRDLLVEYRRDYERMNAGAQYQRALCGMALRVVMAPPQGNQKKPSPRCRGRLVRSNESIKRGCVR